MNGTVEKDYAEYRQWCDGAANKEICRGGEETVVETILARIHESIKANPECAALVVRGLMVRDCEQCAGEGVVSSPEWDRFFARYPEPEQWDDPAVRAEMPQGPEETTCSECDGRGSVLTPVGQEIVNIVNRYGGGE